MTGGPLGAGARIALGAPSLWPVGLAGFLARGGIVLFALPIVALPSVVGLTTFIGPNSVTAAGVAPRLVLLIALTTAVLVVWVVVATLIGAAADRVLVRAVVASEPDAGRALRAPDRDLPTLFVVRLVSLVPFALAVGIGGARLGQVGYQELVLPADSSAPFVIRVLVGAPEVIALLIGGWLVSELIGACAVRLAMRDDRSAARALGGAIGWVVRHPLRSVGTLGATVVVSVIVVGPLIGLSIAAWARVRDLLDDRCPTARRTARGGAVRGRLAVRAVRRRGGGHVAQRRLESGRGGGPSGGWSGPARRWHPVGRSASA